MAQVHLVEDDDLLKATAEDRSNYPDFVPTTLETQWRRSRDLALETQPTTGRILTLPVPHVDWASTAKWAHTFERAAAVLRYLKEQEIAPRPGLANAQEGWAHDDPGLTYPALTWLREHGVPFVHAPQAVPRGSAGRGSSQSPTAHLKHRGPDLFDDSWEFVSAGTGGESMLQRPQEGVA